ncbi:MAG: hypothetical protein CMK50_02595 [Propionibacteriaceae bacterium]|nr:hypothetical protein [Propionibacteriaceae bacterium]
MHARYRDKPNVLLRITRLPQVLIESSLNELDPCLASVALGLIKLCGSTGGGFSRCVAEIY